MKVLSVDRLVIFLYSLFLGVLATGDFGFLGLKIYVITGLVLLFVIIFFSKKKIQYIEVANILFGFLLCFSVIYALLLDVLKGNFLDSIFFSISKIIIIVFFVINVEYFRKIELKDIIEIISKSNILITIVNLVILTFALTPSLMENVYDYSQYGGRLKGFFAQTNGYSLILNFNIAISIYCFLNNKKIFNIFSLFIVFILAIMTQSRGLIIGSIASLFLTYLIFSFYNKNMRFKFVWFVGIGGVFSIFFTLLASTLASFMNQYFGIELSRFNSESDTSYSNKVGEDEVSERSSLFVAGLNTIIQNPLGIGFTDHEIEIFNVTGIPLISHNFYLENILSFGVFFSLLWISIFLYVFYLLLKRVKNIYNFESQNLWILFSLIFFQLNIFFMTHASETIYIWIFMSMAIGFLKNKIWFMVRK